jgi:hypothetical protein
MKLSDIVLCAILLVFFGIVGMAAFLMGWACVDIIRGLIQ